MNKKQFELFVKQLKECEICKENFGFQPHPVFFGDLNSKIVQIGQAPSALVHETLIPFTDKSGERLIKEWYQIPKEKFYDPNNFYILPLAHCFPGKDKNGNDKNPPKICFKTWGSKELEIINNEIYIILGSKAAEVLFPNEKFADLIFKNNYLNNKLTIVLPHPSPANNRWLKKHQDFINKRLPEIRVIIKETINKK